MCPNIDNKYIPLDTDWSVAVSPTPREPQRHAGAISHFFEWNKVEENQVEWQRAWTLGRHLCFILQSAMNVNASDWANIDTQWQCLPSEWSVLYIYYSWHVRPVCPEHLVCNIDTGHCHLCTWPPKPLITSSSHWSPLSTLQMMNRAELLSHESSNFMKCK